MRVEQDGRERQAYEKPRLQVIELLAEEVLGFGCKVNGLDAKGIAGNGCKSGVCASNFSS